MPEQKTFKSPLDIYSIPEHRSPERTYVTEPSGKVSEFSNADWDVEITFTKKVKPIPNGVILFRASEHWIYYKNNGQWVGGFLEDSGLIEESLLDEATILEKLDRGDLEILKGQLQ